MFQLLKKEDPRTNFYAFFTFKTREDLIPFILMFALLTILFLSKKRLQLFVAS
jgi:hypothetical protein